MAGFGWQEIVVLGSLLAFCVLPIAAIVFAVLYFREKRRADGLEAMLRHGGWQGLPSGAVAPPGPPSPYRGAPQLGPTPGPPAHAEPPSDPPQHG